MEPLDSGITVTRPAIGEWLMPRAPRLFLQRSRRRLARGYGAFAFGMKSKTPVLFRLGQMAAWCLRAAWRHKLAAVLLVVACAALVALPFLNAPAWAWRFGLWAAAGLLFAAAAGAAILRGAIRRVMAAQEAALASAIRSARQAGERRAGDLEKRLAAQKTENEKATQAAKAEIARLEARLGATESAEAAKKEITNLRERIAAAERQIGLLRYSNAPDCFVFFGHHKCASRFFRLEVFSRIAEATGARTRRYEIKNLPFHYSRMDELDLLNMDFKGLGKNGRDVVWFANASERSLAKIKQSTKNWKGLRVLRDPRQVLVSDYFHHKGDHPDVSPVGWVWDQLVKDKPILCELPEEEGLLYELDNITRQVIEEQILAPFDDERVLTIKIEDFSRNPREYLAKIAEFLEVPDIAGIDLGNTKANPDGGLWQNHFTLRLREVFKERYGQALIDLGYAEDFDW